VEDIWGEEGVKCQGVGENFIMRSFKTFTVQTYIIRMTMSKSIRWAVNLARMGLREIHIGYWW
jgi:hypothetical protein